MGIWLIEKEDLMALNERNFDKFVEKLVSNSNINDKERVILNRYYNSGDSFSKKIRDFKHDAWKLQLKEGLDSLSDEFYDFYKRAKNHKK